MEYRYRPWVGKNYNNKNIFNQKILILGESHYGYDKMKDGTKGVLNATNTLIKNQLTGVERQRFLTAIHKICTNCKHSEEDFWESVVFYNFIQVKGNLMKPGQRPTIEQWQKSRDLFVKLINQEKPQKILVLGLSLWNNLPNDIGKYVSKDEQLYSYPILKGPDSISTFIYHPSRYPNGVQRRSSTEYFNKLIKS